MGLRTRRPNRLTYLGSPPIVAVTLLKWMDPSRLIIASSLYAITESGPRVWLKTGNVKSASLLVTAATNIPH